MVRLSDTYTAQFALATKIGPGSNPGSSFDRMLGYSHKTQRRILLAKAPDAERMFSLGTDLLGIER